MTKGQKLLNRPLDSETRIIMEDLVNFEDFIGLMELWKWDGITASSVILLNEDVQHLSQEALIETVFRQMKQAIDPQTTFSVKDDYVYINYGFKVD